MKNIFLLAHKDLRTLVRTRGLLVALIVYPALIAVLLLVLLYETKQTATIALVNRDTGAHSVSFGKQHFSVDQYRKQAEAAGNKVIETNYPKAMHALSEGQVVGVLVIPRGFFAKLGSGLQPASIQFYTGTSTIGNFITDRIRGSIYQIDLKISHTLVQQNAGYLKKLVTGGTVVVDGKHFDVMGLKPAVEQLRKVQPHVHDPRSATTLSNVIEFANDTQVGLQLANAALKATAAPVRLEHHAVHGKSPTLTSKAISFALAIALAFVCTVLVAAATAAEHDDGVLGRLLYGISSRLSLLWAKLIIGIVLGVAFSIGLFVVFAVLAPQAWARLPLLLVGVALSALTFAALGAMLAVISRDTRTATLLAVLVVLPLIPMALLNGRGPVHVLSQAFPLDPAQGLMNAMLFDPNPWAALGWGVLHLGSITLVTGFIAWHWMRRLA